MDILGSRGCKVYQVKWKHACLTHLMMVKRRILEMLDKILEGRQIRIFSQLSHRNMPTIPWILG